jgi:hypothetical protein
MDLNGGVSTGEIQVYKPITAPTGNIDITASSSSGTGSVSLTSKTGADVSITSGNVLNLTADPGQAVKINGNSIELSGASLVVGSSGGNSGDFLQININGTNYVITLLNP